jgi:hypothetical protein
LLDDDPGVVHRLLLPPLSGDVTILLFSLLLVKSSVIEQGSKTGSSRGKSIFDDSLNDSEYERYFVEFFNIP